MNARRRFLTAVAATALLLAGCGGEDDAGGQDGVPTGEPAPAQAAESVAAALDPATVAHTGEAALAVALRATDLPAGWSVQANPVPDGSDLAGNPSLAGICGVAFASEERRVVKFPVVGLDPQGAPSVVSEAIGYDSAAAGALALTELRDALSACPAGDRTFVEPPLVESLAEDVVVARYRLADGTTQDVIAQGRGAVVSVLIAEDPAAGAAAAQGIAGRLRALPAAAVGQ
ncbi:hypothetical protein [Trujillonella endophytica]|uniref:PknH-like extracellular domain-containing protein n=1 Tax=Trujillonella endophytica TaxID=673521 RepID=A0A1H8SAK2_9ACTN|nr:hypothetical protein [Trujillella endophytica]SEO75740.1 hypothetical protein SAMN05660991_01560 [Trujillella endophytica]